jgi:hypothetical protein
MVFQVLRSLLRRLLECRLLVQGHAELPSRQEQKRDDGHHKRELDQALALLSTADAKGSDRVSTYLSHLSDQLQVLISHIQSSIWKL